MRILTSALFAAVVAFTPAAVMAAGSATPPPSVPFSFKGVFGAYDNQQLQRGFQVYKQICAGCHSLDYIAFRNLAEIGYPEEQIKAIAEEYMIVDGPDSNGDMFERPGKPFDYFPAPFANEQQARAAMGGAYPPDLSLMAKARPYGADYIAALLQGYRDQPPADFKGNLLPGQYYNEYMAGNVIAMAQPLWGNDVQYQDGTEATVQQQAEDVAAFLMWTAEPKMEVRKETGIKAMLFLVVLTGLLYAAKRKIWKDLH